MAISGSIAARRLTVGRASLAASASVRAHGWLTTDHPQAYWFRVTQHSPDWSQVRVEVTPQREDEPTELDVIVQPNGYVCRKRLAYPAGGGGDPYYRHRHPGRATRRRRLRCYSCSEKELDSSR